MLLCLILGTIEISYRRSRTWKRHVSILLQPVLSLDVRRRLLMWIEACDREFVPNVLIIFGEKLFEREPVPCVECIGTYESCYFEHLCGLP